jgi:transcription antitermination factor NusG
LRCAPGFASYQPDKMTTTETLFWFVAHTRPRREKKLTEYCEREGFQVTLPCYRAVHKYRGKTVTFLKPLFPGYVFLQLLDHQRQKVYQSDYVANLLDVPDQETFAHQLGDILQALETDLEVCLAPQITAGARVRIKSGPLRGLEGYVQERAGVTMVLLRLDFISQAAAVKIEATELEIA